MEYPCILIAYQAVDSFASSEVWVSSSYFIAGSNNFIFQNGRQNVSINSDTSWEAEHSRWQPIVAKYAKPHLGRSLWQVANTLIQAAQAATLLGARVILVGIRPEIAQSIVSLGIDLRQITSKPTLEVALQQLTVRQ